MADFHISKPLLIIIVTSCAISIIGEIIHLITIEDYSQFGAFEIFKVLQSLLFAFLIYYFVKKYQQQHE